MYALMYKPQTFSSGRADVLPFVSISFPNREHKFYCPQLWVVRPTVVGYITHSYGLYNPQLWAVKLVRRSWKTHAVKSENSCQRNAKKRLVHYKKI